MHKRGSVHILFIIVLAFGIGACRPAEDPNLTIYSGRSKSLVEPLVEQFSTDTGIQVDIRYGDTAEMAIALIEEGDQTRADLFWAQDAGALGAVSQERILASLPDSILSKVSPRYRSPAGRWVATSGRARTIAYSSERVKPSEVPASVFDLTKPEYRGRVGWAPANGSFQAFVTALRRIHGEERARAWLVDMKANGAVAYPRNTAILQGIANGEIDFGLPNHYYLYRFKSEDSAFPVEQKSFHACDIGILVNVAGIGIVANTNSPEAALRFVSYALGSYAQGYFASETFEYPVSAANAGLALPPDSLLPAVELDNLGDLEATLDLLREVGLL